MPTLPNPATGGAYWADCAGCGALAAIPTGQDRCPQCRPTTRGRAAPVTPGRLLAAARASAALLRQLVPGRRDFTDLVDEICCPLCHTWVPPRRFVPTLNCCHTCTAGMTGGWGWPR